MLAFKPMELFCPISKSCVNILLRWTNNKESKLSNVTEGCGCVSGLILIDDDITGNSGDRDFVDITLLFKFHWA